MANTQHHNMIQLDTPQSMEAEQAVLGSILLNRDALTAVAPFLTPAMFYQERHSLIYTAMLTCFKRKTPPDTRLVSEALRSAGHLDGVGGYLYLTDLVQVVPTSAHVVYYAREVERLATLRRMLDAGAHICKIAYEAYNSGKDYDVALSEAQSALTSAIGRGRQHRMVPISEVVDQYYETIANGEIPGLRTGFRDLDELLGGLYGGDLMILAARPSVGKSSFALSLVNELAPTLVGTGQTIGVFSMEMNRDQLNLRLLSMRSGVDTKTIKQGVKMRDSDLSRVIEAAGVVHQLPIHMNDLTDLHVDDIRSLSMQMAMEQELALIIIDYLQLLESRGRRENRNQEITEISRGLKKLAMELRCPIIALSQLSRAVEGRTSKVPVLSDLRDSGSIEQDGDIVGFLYREELYVKDTDKKGIAELHIAKARNGPVGVVPFRFDAQTTKFSTLTYRDPGMY